VTVDWLTAEAAAARGLAVRLVGRAALSDGKTQWLVAQILGRSSAPRRAQPQQHPLYPAAESSDGDESDAENRRDCLDGIERRLDTRNAAGDRSTRAGQRGGGRNRGGDADAFTSNSNGSDRPRRMSMAERSSSMLLAGDRTHHRGSLLESFNLSHRHNGLDGISLNDSQPRLQRSSSDASSGFLAARSRARRPRVIMPTGAHETPLDRGLEQRRLELCRRDFSTVNAVFAAVAHGRFAQAEAAAARLAVPGQPPTRGLMGVGSVNTSGSLLSPNANGQSAVADEMRAVVEMVQRAVKASRVLDPLDDLAAAEAGLAALPLIVETRGSVRV
jgi:hypothetical protein